MTCLLYFDVSFQVSAQVGYEGPNDMGPVIGEAGAYPGVAPSTLHEHVHSSEMLWVHLKVSHTRLNKKHLMSTKCEEATHSISLFSETHHCSEQSRRCSCRSSLLSPAVHSVSSREPLYSLGMFRLQSRKTRECLWKALYDSVDCLENSMYWVCVESVSISTDLRFFFFQDFSRKPGHIILK